MTIVHLTARLRAPLRGLADDDQAPWLWARLRRRFPGALGTVLMPNHPHLVAEVGDVRQAHATFVRVLGAYSHRLKGGPEGEPLHRSIGPIWEPVPAPKIIQGPDKVARELRYLDLNAPRAELVDDVLAWRWSTHLDVVGAIDDPWVPFDRLRRFVPERLGRSVEAWHSYASADPRTNVAGTPLPRAVEPTEIARRPLRDVLEAVAWATRCDPRDVTRCGPTRRAFIWLAREQGWAKTGQIAEICGIARQSVARILREPRPTAIEPARLCLDLVELGRRGGSRTSRAA